MSQLLEWAKKEVELLGHADKSIQQLANQHILELVELFAKQGHTNLSAHYVIVQATRLMDWKPLTPLTGEDDEWLEPYAGDDNNRQQNRRYFNVFRENFDNATAYNSEGKIFSDNGGETWFTNRDSSTPITFPYVVPDRPEEVLVKRDTDENDIF